MPIVKTHELTTHTPLAQFDSDQIYCGLDSCLTLEIFESIQTIYGASGVPQDWRGIYSFERALQAPYYDLMTRGFRVDGWARQEAIQSLRERICTIQQVLDQLSTATQGSPVNPRSQKQLQYLFYTVLALPELWISIKGERKLSMGREVLEKLHERYLYSRPFVNCILTIRDLAKQLEVFESKIDSDGRFRASYNIAGTETGRPSSSENAFGTGRNAQNIAPNLRHVFVADPEHVLVVVDLEQVEARDVGFFCGCLFGEWGFLDACESGDLHTNNAKRIWPELGWTGDRKADKKIAEQNFYRDFSYRDMAKRGSHLSNYMGTAWTAARSLKLPLAIMEDFQARYCRGDPKRGIEPAYPCIPRWWRWVAEQLQTTRQLVTPFGRRRHFFGRPGDDTTLREAIAFLPQSTTADRMNLGLWRVWRHEPRAQLLAQTYDSITFQVSQDDNIEDCIGNVLHLLGVELFGPAPDYRHYVVPGEAKWGWNWGPQSEHNPDGLRKWSPSQLLPARANGMQRMV
jgi:DNA polymerase I-like protein with 3'-5' exonuclease and polymerase domains